MSAAEPVDIRREVEAIWRIESARLIAGLARMTGDLGAAEDLAQDAMVVALERWPRDGVPSNPGAWLMTTARNRGIDEIRRRANLERKRDQLGLRMEVDRALSPDLEAELDDHIGDELLSLVFTTCHPVLPTDAQVALTLRLFGGLTTADVARAFLTSEATVAQRIVRAKRTLAASRVPIEVPGPDELPERLSAVLGVLYLIYNEGYAARSGESWTRPELCADATRMGRVLAGLVPEEAEVHGLVALMEIQSSRLRARIGPRGRPITLMEQDRSRWDRLLIGRGLASLRRALALGGVLGPYTLQAEIAACHARAAHPEDTDWDQIVACYDALAQISPSAVVELNRAVAVGMAHGPAAGLELTEALRDDPAMRDYHLLPAVRADLLAKLGRVAEARGELARAAEMTTNEAERKLLEERLATLGAG